MRKVKDEKGEREIEKSFFQSLRLLTQSTRELRNATTYSERET